MLYIRFLNLQNPLQDVEQLYKDGTIKQGDIVCQQYNDKYSHLFMNGTCVKTKYTSKIAQNTEIEDDVKTLYDLISNNSTNITDISTNLSNISTNLSDNYITKSQYLEDEELIASSFASYERYLKFGKQMKQECNSEYLGEEGESIEFTVSDHKLLKKGTSKFKNGNSSNWFLYKIIDDAGNVIMAFMDHNCEFEFNHCNKIKATISKLSEFNNVKQTSISRVKFLD